MRPPRFRPRTLMAAILIVGGLAGTLARLDDQRRRSDRAWARLMLRRQVTDAAVALGRADPGSAGRRPPSSRDDFSLPEQGPLGPWSYEARSWGGGIGEGPPLIHVRVEGDGRGAAPLTIRDHGSPRNGPVVGRLVRAYRERGWPYRVVAAAEAKAPSR
jgi:hypothetical protein